MSSMEGAVTTLFEAPLVGLDDDALLDVAREVEVARRRLAAVDHRLISELDRRVVAGRRLCRDTAALLSDVLHIDRGEARARVLAAAELGLRTTLAGQILESVLPATAAAQARGEVSPAHAREVSRAMAQLPSALGAEVWAAAECRLAEEATHLTPRQLAVAGERLVAHLDPDGRLTDDADRARRRNITIGPQGADGTSAVRGVLSPECRALVDAAFARLAAPAPDDGVPDTRSPGQRRHDALASVCRHALAAGTVGAARGAPATVVVTVGLDDLERRAGRTTTATGGSLTVPEALDLAADGSWALCVLDHRGQPLWLGRSVRLATAAQRRALGVRDGGCTRPGCDVPAAWCEAHHLVAWQDGGVTDLDNLALVCAFDHHLITDAGYTVALGRLGRVIWTAPAWLDPTRTPRINGAHRVVPSPQRAQDRPP